MTKEVLIALIQKDIRDLEVLSQSFYVLAMPSETMLKLASSKAQEVVENLQKLSEIKVETAKAEMEENEKLVAKISINEPKHISIEVDPELIENEPENTEKSIESVTIKEKEATLEELSELIIKNEEPENITIEYEAIPIQEELETIEEVEVATPIIRAETIETIPTAVETIEKAEETVERVLEDVKPAATLKRKIEEEKEEPIVIADKIELIKEEVKIEPNSIPEEKISTSATIEKKTSRIFNSKEASIMDSFLNKKITDLKQSISIADRFRFQRELFSSNAEKMNETFAFLNSCTQEEEALQYLSKNFNWDRENETVEEFLNTVHRLFQ